MTEDKRNQTGTTLTCTNPDCGCLLRIEQPCPHGDAYLCACGHLFRFQEDAPAADQP
jgi:hypothetical protein